jgi:hypothetical protein
MRAKLLVELDLDRVPGYGYTADSHAAKLRDLLGGPLGHYGPTVKVTLPDDECGRGCGHVFVPGETRMYSRYNGCVCLSCTLPQDFERVDPADPHADEIRDALSGHR